MFEYEKLTPTQRHVVEAVDEGSRFVRSRYSRHPALAAMIEGENPELKNGLVVKRGKGFVEMNARGFSWQRLVEAVENLQEKRLLEATTSGAVGQLLRAQVQNVANNWLKENIAKFAYGQIAATSNSNKAFEHYAPAHGSKVQRRKADAAPHNRTGIFVMDVPILNETYAGGEEFSGELFEDDQTGQISGRANDLGIAAARTLEVFFALRFVGAGGSFDVLNVPASNWPNLRTAVNQNKAAVGGVFTAEGATGLGNRLTTFVQLGVPGLKRADDLAQRMQDAQGNIVGIEADTLLHTPRDRRNAAMLMGSDYYPAVPGFAADTAASAQSGFASGSFGMNPWKGSYTPVNCNYLTAGVWAIGARGKGLMLQIRKPVQIDMEAPNAGESFESWVVRLRSLQRFGFDWIDPRHWILGNDGTAAFSF